MVAVIPLAELFPVPDVLQLEAVISEKVPNFAAFLKSTEFFKVNFIQRVALCYYKEYKHKMITFQIAPSGGCGLNQFVQRSFFGLLPARFDAWSGSRLDLSFAPPGNDIAQVATGKFDCHECLT